jgi:hypothetical protein
VPESKREAGVFSARWDGRRPQVCALRGLRSPHEIFEIGATDANGAQLMSRELRDNSRIGFRVRRDALIFSEIILTPLSAPRLARLAGTLS